MLSYVIVTSNNNLYRNRFRRLYLEISPIRMHSSLYPPSLRLCASWKTSLKERRRMRLSYDQSYQLECNQQYSETRYTIRYWSKSAIIPRCKLNWRYNDVMMTSYVREREMKGWMLIALCVGCFPPSKTFLPCFMNLISTQVDKESNKGECVTCVQSRYLTSTYDMLQEEYATTF